MKDRRRHAPGINFLRGKMISPFPPPKEKKDGPAQPLSRQHNGEVWERHGNGHLDVHAIENAGIDAASLLSPPHSLLGHKPADGNRPKLKIVILGLSITPSHENHHSTIYRGLVRELTARGHDVLFLERETEWHAKNRDLQQAPHGRTEFYSGVKELKQRFSSAIREADLIIVGSSVHEGMAIGEWVTRAARGATAFYDIDTQATMAGLIRGGVDYISPALIPRYQIYLSCSGGPLLRYIEKHYGSPMARPLYCSVDTTLYFPEEEALNWDLGYLGAYSDDRQRTLDRLLLEAARRWGEGSFVVAGSHYPRSVHWPRNVRHLTRLPVGSRREFYNSQRFALNVTRAGMVASGFSPAMRLFEAAACGTPIISDFWQGIGSFFKADEEILISHSADETLIYLEEISELDRRRMGYRARERVLAKHSTRHRAVELEGYAFEVLKPAAP